MLKWNSKPVTDKVMLATAKGIDSVMSKCVGVAKGLVRVKTATLQGSIRITPTKMKGNELVGVWGSFGVNYAIFQETGTFKMSAQPYLRPSADRLYPTLPGEIKRFMA